MEGYSAKERYTGKVAVHYEKIRTGCLRNRRRWNAELTCVDRIMSSISEDSCVLDVPCGTGRFFPVLLKHGCRIVGIDISQDMIQQISREVLCDSKVVGVHTGDATSLDYPDSHFDYVLCMRFFNIVPDRVRLNALKEFARVVSKGIFIEVRFRGYGPVVSSVIRVTRVLFRKAKNIIKRIMVVGNKTAVSVPEETLRASLKEFRTLVESLGLRLVKIHRVAWGFTLSPMTICHLEPHNHSEVK